MNENHEGPTNGRDDIATLVRLAGKREAVPADRTARVRAAAEAAWRDTLELRSRKRRVWTAAAALAAACGAIAITWWVLPPGGRGTAPAAATIRVDALSGNAWVRGPERGAEPRPIAAGEDLPSGAEVSTGEQGRVALRWPSGHSVRLDAATRIRGLDARTLVLDRGALYVDSGSGPAHAALTVHTPLGVVEEQGTQFEVRLDGESVRVRLREGSVVVRRDDGVHEVEAGFELRLDPGGGPQLRPLAPHGPDWEWLASVTPMLDVEGRTARAFLDWVARERGWTLAFEDEAAARSARETVLTGTVERLTLEEALDAVLATSRLAYRVEGGVLRVASLQ